MQRDYASKFTSQFLFTFILCLLFAYSSAQQTYHGITPAQPALPIAVDPDADADADGAFDAEAAAAAQHACSPLDPPSSFLSFLFSPRSSGSQPLTASTWAAVADAAAFPVDWTFPLSAALAAAFGVDFAAERARCVREAQHGHSGGGRGHGPNDSHGQCQCCCGAASHAGAKTG